MICFCISKDQNYVNFKDAKKIPEIKEIPFERHIGIHTDCYHFTMEATVENLEAIKAVLIPLGYLINQKGSYSTD
jgi:hypothetical protein